MSLQFGHTMVPRKSEYQMTLILICIFNIQVDILKLWLYSVQNIQEAKLLDKQVKKYNWELILQSIKILKSR